MLIILKLNNLEFSPEKCSDKTYHNMLKMVQEICVKTNKNIREVCLILLLIMAKALTRQMFIFAFTIGTGHNK